ncbi:hypothetical protein VW23_004210 [Devosia insulae DS-56]|uniref:Uncharacterized protein n=1 Tax=Devosia insulae DS-56 TaxID=1116389 RepID=A0A1E5XJ81_9HYPH|nr:hypothetical protein VW23_004210 [Devosia insulae DS-56]
MAWVFILACVFLSVNLIETTDRAVIAFALIAVGSAVGQLRDPNWDDRLIALLTVYLVIHLGGFIFQVGQFLLQGQILELHGLIFPSASRAYQIGTAARLSGFQIEPGTYAQWMLMATFLRCLLLRRIISPLTVAIVASTLVTLSLWAVIGAALFSAGAIIEAVFQSTVRNKFRATYLVLIFGVAFLIFFYSLPDATIRDSLTYLDVKADLTSTSGTDKVAAVGAIFERVFDVLIFGAPMGSRFCEACLSPQDVGIWANLIYYFGLLPTLAVVGLTAWSIASRWGPSYLPLLVALLSWKAQFYDPFLWIILGYALHPVARTAPTERVATGEGFEPRPTGTGNLRP